MDYSYCCGSPWKSHVRGVIHNHISLHNWTVPYSCTVRQQQSNGASLTTDNQTISSVRTTCLTEQIYINLTVWFFRQNGLGYTAFISRLGVALSPLIILLEDFWHLLPEVTYCAVAVGSSLVSLFLHETVNARLPEFIEDIEKPKQQADVLKVLKE